MNDVDIFEKRERIDNCAIHSCDTAQASRSAAHVLVNGGSQVSQRMNRAVVDALPLLEDVHVVHQTGPREYDRLRQRRARGYEVSAFISDMTAAMSRADLGSGRAPAHRRLQNLPRRKASLLVPFRLPVTIINFTTLLLAKQAGCARSTRR